MYWREWARPTGLWRFHVLIGLAVGFAVAVRGDLSHFSPSRFAITALVATFTSIVLFSVWPQIRFKPQTRVLTLNAEGFKTTIGTRSGQRHWRDIRQIEEHEGTIVIIGNNGNAMIVPRRAFATDADRRDCLQTVQQWHARRGTAVA